jgi:hypothetical protein
MSGRIQLSRMPRLARGELSPVAREFRIKAKKGHRGRERFVFEVQRDANSYRRAFDSEGYYAKFSFYVIDT